MFLTSLDITVNVALPNITDSFGTDAVTIQWIIILYVGSSTAMHLGLGGAADAFGLKRMFVLGLIAYTLAVVAIGFAQSLGAVFGLRVFQALGNGLLMALAPAIVTYLFPAEFRGRALGIMAALGTLGMMVGSLGGGALVDAFGWRAIFLGRAPLCLAAIAFSTALLKLPDTSPSPSRKMGRYFANRHSGAGRNPESRDERCVSCLNRHSGAGRNPESRDERCISCLNRHSGAGRNPESKDKRFISYPPFLAPLSERVTSLIPRPPRGFDAWGATTLFTAVGALILMLSLGGRHGWTAAYVPLLGVISLASVAAFIAVERRAERPVLQLSVLRNRVLAPALVVSILAMVSTFVNWFLLPFFVVESLGASASVWGLLLMLMTIATAMSAPLGGWLSDRWHPAYTITAGLVAATVAMVALAFMDQRSSVLHVALGLIGVGVGTGLFQSANANLIMGNMPPDRLGMGGGVMGLSRGLGTVFSVAIMGAIFSARVTAREATLPEDQAFIQAFQDTYRIATALGLTAIAVSCTIWPKFQKHSRRPRP